MDHLAGQVVVVVVRVDIDGQVARRRAEQGLVLRVPAYGLGPARAADVTVEADHPVGRGHHDVQVVGDHEGPAPPARPDARNELVQFELPRYVHPLDRLVEDQQVGLPQERARQEDAPQLAAREVGRRLVDQTVRAHFVEDPGHGLRGRAARQPEEPPDRQGDDRVDGEALGQVAHDQARTPPDRPRVRLDEAEQDADERRFPGAVGPDECHNLARVH